MNSCLPGCSPEGRNQKANTFVFKQRCLLTYLTYFLLLSFPVSKRDLPVGSRAAMEESATCWRETHKLPCKQEARRIPCKRETRKSHCDPMQNVEIVSYPRKTARRLTPGCFAGLRNNSSQSLSFPPDPVPTPGWRWARRTQLGTSLQAPWPPTPLLEHPGALLEMLVAPTARAQKHGGTQMYASCMQTGILRVDPPFPFCIHLQAPGPPSSRTDKNWGGRLEIGDMAHVLPCFCASAVGATSITSHGMESFRTRCRGGPNERQPSGVLAEHPGSSRKKEFPKCAAKETVSRLFFCGL